VLNSTCLKEKCPYWDIYEDKCPFYIETMWSPQEGGQPTVMEDCSPKRTVLVVMDIMNRLVGVQQANEQQRNKTEDLLNVMLNVIVKPPLMPVITVAPTEEIKRLP
jgi:hypothetical protein